MDEIIMGRQDTAWHMGEVITVTLCVTEACNLACKYCYMIHKNNHKEMRLETGKRIIDYILSSEMPIDDESIVLEFIGGEPTLRIDLISQLCDYFVAKLYLMNHKWFNNYRFNFSSNGLLYSSDKVQQFLARHKGHISFGISLDGTKEKHDLSRVKPDGTGSYDDVFKNVGLWRKQFSEHSTKATFSHEDIRYLKDSIIHLWNSGIHNVMANIVFEDVWESGDEQIYEDQLNQLADYIVENDLWYTRSVRFFSSHIGLPGDISVSMCGAGRKMLAFDPDGNIFPCTRFFDFCLDDDFKPLGCIGKGIDMDRLKPFREVRVKDCMADECRNCLISDGCYHCLGNNFYSYRTIYQKPKFGCEMHKANVRANNRLWYMYSKKKYRTSPITERKVMLRDDRILKFLYIITGDDVEPVCAYDNKLNSRRKMSDDMLAKCIEYCFKHHIAPVFVGKCQHGLSEDNIYFTISGEDAREKNHATVYTADGEYENNNIILSVHRSDIKSMGDKLANIRNKQARVNVFVPDIDEWGDSDFEIYYDELGRILDLIREKKLDLNPSRITLFKSSLPALSRCGAGRTSIAVAPDGKFYLCPAFYFEKDTDAAIGNMDENFEFAPIEMLATERMPICSECSKSCNICIHDNRKATGELNIPSDKQCRIRKINDEFAKKAGTLELVRTNA